MTHCVFPQAAGNAVKRASDNLVKAAQKAAFDAQDDQAVVVKSKMVGGIAQVRQRCQKQEALEILKLLFPRRADRLCCFCRSLLLRKRCCGKKGSWMKPGRSWP